MGRIVLIFLLLYSNLATAASIKSFRLFTDKGQYSFGYNQKMKKIMKHFDEGNTEPIELVFSHGYKFQVNSIIGRGDFFNVVFDIGNNQVLRVRQTRKKLFSLSFFMLHNAPMFDSFHSYKQAYQILKPLALPVAESFFTETNDHEFLVQERLNIDYYYTDYVYDDLREKIPEEVVKQMDQDFLKLVRQTARISLILDLRDENIVYDKNRGWILLDFWDDIRFVETFDDPNLFEKGKIDEIEIRARNLIKDGGGAAKPVLAKPGLPRHISEKARKVIMDERAKYFNPRLCNRSAAQFFKSSLRNSLLGLKMLKQVSGRQSQ